MYRDFRALHPFIDMNKALKIIFQRLRTVVVVLSFWISNETKVARYLRFLRAA
jgi:hypothetical protein